MTYRVTAKKWDGGWELHIDGVGVTQTENLGDAEAMVRDYLDVLDLNAKTSIELTYELGDGLDSEVAAARAATVEAANQQTAAAAKTRAVARKLKARNMRHREISTVMGVSEQRISQLLKS